MGILNGNWTVYQDPEWAMGKKRASKENRRLSGLIWDEEGFFLKRRICEKRSKYIWDWAKVEDVANPDYEPWIYIIARKLWNKDDPEYLAETIGGYEFVCQPNTKTVYYRRLQSTDDLSSISFTKLKQNRKIHTTLIEKIEEIKVSIRRVITHPGFIHAPYIPKLKSPTIDPNDFTLRKGIRTRFQQKIMQPKFFHRITVTDL